ATTKAGEAATSAATAETARDEVIGAVQKIESSGLIGKDGKVSFAADNAGSQDSARAVGIDSTALGYGSEAKGNDSTVIGNHAFASGTGSVALGNGSVAAEDYTVSVGSAGHERRITNVQSPRHATDAANKAYVDSIRDEWKSADKKLRGGIAAATAIANLPQANGSSNSMLSLAVGNYRGQNAFAIGYSKVSDNNRVTLKISGSASTAGDYNFGAGIGFQW
ncbi:YadA family autotransporter adhesin, partial [Neisseria cinerea]|uniref:YadA family autotransporter adhesin n=1 Tax=Neisseria cinerea TaxID=483 RepID=UPI00288A165A